MRNSSRSGVGRRAIALLLSWIVPANGAWAALPAPARAAQEQARPVSAGRVPGPIGVRAPRVPVARPSDSAARTARSGGAQPERHDVHTLAAAETQASPSVAPDMEMPELELVEPLQGQLLGSESVTVRGTVMDASPVSVRVGDVLASVVAGVFTAEGVALPAAEGQADVTLPVTAEDAAGNKRETTLRLRIDREAPQVTITRPSAAQPAKGHVAEVEGTVSDKSPVLVMVNGQAALLSCAGSEPEAMPTSRGPKGQVWALSGTCTFKAQVPVKDGRAAIEALAVDGAGNESRARVEIAVDTQAPEISVDEPQSGATRATSVRLAGTVSEEGGVELTLDGRPLKLDAGRFAADLQLPKDGSYKFQLRARDSAGNVAERAVELVADHTAPVLRVVQPEPGALVTKLPLVVRGLASDQGGVTVTVAGQAARFTQGAWEVELAELGEGGAAKLEIVAKDAAGNETRETRELRLDLQPPVIGVDQPQAGLLTREQRVTVSGTVTGAKDTRVEVGGVQARVTWAGRTGRFTAEVVLDEGDNVLVAQALDPAGRRASAQTVVTRDSTPPVVMLVAPEMLGRAESKRAVAQVSDESPIASVAFVLNGRTLSTLARPPYGADVQAPAGRSAGDTLQLEVVATDAAGNVGRSAQSVAVAGSGVLVGQILDDLSGRPLAGATVHVLANGTQVAQPAVDERGRYSAELQAETALVLVEKPGFLSVAREVALLPGAAVVVVDARLTALAESAPVPASGGTLEAALRITTPQVAEGGAAAAAGQPLSVNVSPSCTDRGGCGQPSGRELLQRHFSEAQGLAASGSDLSVSVPSGAVSTETQFRLTSLSAQGLPGLLPLGWSPLVALDVRTASGSVSQPLGLAVSGLGLASGTAQLVEFRPVLQAWVLIQANVAVSGGAATASLPELGSYALVVADTLTPPLAVPAVGAVLPGAASVPVPPTAQASGLVEPPIVPPSGETALGSLVLGTTAQVPSGTVISAEVQETYELSSGQTAVEETRVQDLLIYRQPLPAGASVGATFPIRPARAFEQGELLSGSVKLKVKSGREGVRGTPGGSDAVQIVNGDVRLQVPAGALPQNTALTIEQIQVPEYAPQGDGLEALHAVLCDFSGQVFQLDAELSIASSTTADTDLFALARLVRVQGVPRAELVALAVRAAGRIVSTPYAGLPGVRRGGEYVFYRLASPLGFVAGVTRAQENGALAAVVATDGLPFVGLSKADGSYIVGARPGAVLVSASVPGTSLAGSAQATVLASQTSALDVALVGSVTSAQTRPVDGAQAVDPGWPIEIETTTALDPATATLQNVHLVRVDAGGDQPVTLRLVLSASRKLLAAIPEQALAFDTAYRFEAAGLRDAFGGAVTVVPVHFRTRTDAPANYDLDQLVFHVPDAAGMVQVRAPAGTLAPGTYVLVMNAGNGATVGCHADNDGAVACELPGSVHDRLFITVSDPVGHLIEFERSQYFDAASGLTTVNTGGGSISGAGGVKLTLPEGALAAPARIKLELLDPTQYPDAGYLPDLGEHAQVGGVVKIESPDHPVLRKPLGLVFPKPAGVPPDADVYYHLRRRLQGPGDVVMYQDIGEARYFPEADAPLAPEGARAAAPGRSVTAQAAATSTASAAPPCFIARPPRTITNSVMSLDSMVFSNMADFNSGVNSFGATDSLAASYAIVMTEVLRLLPGSPIPGIVVGKVQRAVWGPAGSPAEYVPVPDAMVFGRDMGGEPFLYKGNEFAVSRGDGSFGLTDPRYTGGPITVTAVDPETGTPYTATGYQESPQNSDAQIRGCYNQATVTVTLPALEPPPPPPAIAVRLFKLVAGERVEITNGLVPEAEPILIGLTPVRPAGLPANAPLPYDVEAVQIAGQYHGFSPDPMIPPGAPLANRYLVDGGGPGGLYVPQGSGTVTVRVQVRRDTTNEPFYVTYSFRLVGQAGGVDNDPLNPPRVLEAQTMPARAETRVSIMVEPHLAFSEPVTQALSNVRLLEDGTTPVPLRLTGIDGAGVVPTVTDQSAVSSVTLEPRTGLKFGKSYVLQVQTGLLDQDVPPKALPEEYQSNFTTYNASELPNQVGEDSIAGFGVLGDRAYVAQTNSHAGTGPVYQNGNLKVYDISDLSAIDGDIQAARRRLHAPPAELAIDPQRKLAAVAQMSFVAMGYDGDGNYDPWSNPGNVYLFDIHLPDEPKWVGAVSLTGGIMSGNIRRIVTRDARVYAATWRKGIQIVTVDDMVENFPANPELNQDFMKRILLRGVGWGMENVVTIPVWDNPLAEPAQRHVVNLFGLDVADLDWQGVVRPLVAATGQHAGSGLVLADPGSVQIVKQIALPPMQLGDAIKVGTVAGKPLALVSGRGETIEGGILQVVDLSPLATGGDPVILSSLLLEHAATDILIKGNLAILATMYEDAYVINLNDPTEPQLNTTLHNVGSRLALTDLGLLLSTTQTYMVLPSEIGLHGLHATAIEPQVCPEGGAILKLVTPEVALKQIVDPDQVDGLACAEPGRMVFSVCAASRVTIKLEGSTLQASLDGGPVGLLSGITVEPGYHTVSLPGTIVEAGRPKQFVVASQVIQDPSIERSAEGRVVADRQNRVVRPVGHTIVQGVDVALGHLTVGPTEDFALPGRHLPLSMSRTYSSSGESSAGAIGAGWSWNFDLQLHKGDDQGCGLVSLTGRDGSQVFRPAGNGQYTPQKGYHGELKLNSDGTFDYWDKAHNRHRFVSPDGGVATGPVDYKLDYIVEPHGDKLEFHYSQDGQRLERVVEALTGSTSARHLRISWVTRQGVDRIVSVEAFTGTGENGSGTPLGLRADYQYDYWGNLLTATRSGKNIGTGPDRPDRVWTYRYSDTDVRDRHQMAEVLNPNRASTKYDYYTAQDVFPNETAGSQFQDKPERVKAVVQQDTRTLRTEFTYFPPDPTTFLRKTGVQPPDSQASAAIYTTDMFGLLRKLEEGGPLPNGRATETTWKPGDVLKETETDPENRKTTYGYDAKGNQTLESIETTDLGLIETHAEFDQKYNKPTSKRDAENRETVWGLDPANGDVLSMRDAEGNETTYHYSNGQLTSETDARDNTTTYSEHNEFGQWELQTDVRGNKTHREYDDRGRLTREWDDFGRSAIQQWDGLDRLFTATRKAGHNSPDEISERTYKPNGEVWVEKAPGGAETSFEIDGLGRVTAATTSYNTGGFGQGSIRVEKSYDRSGNLETETDAAGVKRRHIYDAFNRLVRTDIIAGPPSPPFGQLVSYEYAKKVDVKTGEVDKRRNVRTVYTLDGLYRVTAKSLPDQSMSAGFQPSGPLTERYEYDKVGNRTALVDANGHRTETKYDKLNRPVQIVKDPGQGGLALTNAVWYCNEPGDAPDSSGINKCEERDVTRGLRVLYTYDNLNREISRTQRLEGPDGSPQPLRVNVTNTSFQDSDHQVTVDVTDPPRATHTTITRLDGLDRVWQTVVDPTGLNLETTTTYDALGKPLSVLDPRGNLTLFRQDGLGRTWKTTDANGNASIVQYTPDGLKAREKDRRGVWRKYTYDNLRRLKSEALETPSLSGVPWNHTIEYLDAQRERWERDAKGAPTKFTLDMLGRVTRETDVDDNFVETTWDGVNKRAVQDKRGNKTLYEYDATDRLVKVTDPLPFATQTVVTAYDDLNNRVTEFDRHRPTPTPKVTQLDSLGRVRTVTRAGVLLEKNLYDGLGNKIDAEDGEGKKTHFDYDSGNRLLRRVDGVGTADAAQTEYRYDENGNKLKEIDARSSEAEPAHEYHYDKLNRVDFEWDGERNLTEYGYDEEGSRIRQKDAKGQETKYAYDELGKLTSVTQPATAAGIPVTTYTYDVNRNKVEQKDANGHKVVLGYDNLNRLKDFTQEGGLNTHREYDANGNIQELTDPNGQKTTNEYDQLNRLTSATYDLASTLEVPWRRTTAVSYQYDENSNPTTVTETVVSQGSATPTTATTIRGYDLLDRMTSETTNTGQGPVTVGYGYYLNGTRKTVTDNDQLVTLYEYDGQNRLKTVKTQAGTPQESATSYFYWPDDLLKQVDYPNGVVASYGYDKADRLTSLTNAKDATVVSSYGYGYDSNGNRLTQTEVNGGLSETTGYGYDSLNRLASVTYPVDASHPNGRKVTYGYDLVGNRQSEIETNNLDVVTSNKVAIFDALNRLSSVTDSVQPSNNASFAYDANGNVRTKTSGGAATTYVYDTRDKLVETRDGAQETARFQYDFEGRRTQKIGDGGIVRFVYDDTSVLQELNELGLTQAKYEWGPDRLISLVRTNESRRFYLFDGLGSVTGLTNDGGTGVASYHLDAWGNYRFPTELGASQNRFGFTGHYWDTETELYYAKARYFDPEFGRFLTQDDYLGEIDDPPSLHRYFYANANPTRYTDPTGHMSWDEFSAGASAFVNDIAENGARRVLDTGTKVVDGVNDMAIQTAAMAYDTAALTVETGLRMAGEDVTFELQSRLAASTGERLANGESAGAIMWDSATNIALNTATVGAYGTVQEYHSIYKDFQAGKLNAADLEGRLTSAASRLVTDAAMASAGSHAAGQGWRGSPMKLPKPGQVVEAMSQVGGRARAAAESVGQGIKRVFGVGCNCFVAGTLIATSMGPKPIEEIAVGDFVYGWDEETRVTTLAPVSGLFDRVAEGALVLTIGEDRVEVTEDHPFWVEGRGWVTAGNLLPGDVLQSFDGAGRPIDSIERSFGERRVYNFTVDELHDYFVSNARVVAHNCTWPPPTGGVAPNKSLVQLREGAAEALGKGTRYKSTAVGRYENGQVRLASSDELVPRAQRRWAEEQGIETVRGIGHAEETLRTSANDATGRLVEVEVDSPHGRAPEAPHGAICVDCQRGLDADGVSTTSPFSGRPSRRRAP